MESKPSMSRWPERLQPTTSPMKETGFSAWSFLAGQSYRFNDRGLALPAAYLTIGLGHDFCEGHFARLSYVEYD
jgi:hypothetical protein